MLHGKCTINIRFGCNGLAEAQLSFMEYINSSQFKLFAASIIPIHVLSTLGSDYSEHYTDTIHSFCSLVG